MDIVVRLKDKRYDCCDENMRCNGDLMEEAADEIERLREENEFFKKLIQADQLKAVDNMFESSIIQHRYTND
jgi:hypothetical protein